MIGIQADTRAPRATQAERSGVSQRAIFAVLAVLLIAASLIGAFWLAGVPAISPDTAQGLYEREGDANPYYWMSKRVIFPIREHSGPSHAIVTLRSAAWAERQQAAEVRLSVQGQELAQFTATDQARSYHILLPTSAEYVELESTVEQTPTDPRWFGPQLVDLRVKSFGMPTEAIKFGALAVILSIPLAFALAWCFAQGYGWLVLITLLGLLLRMYRLDAIPAGYFQDEAVSLVDALHLARTGHDHLGHFLPLGALESFGDWVSPLIVYISLPFVAVFGPSMMVGRILAAFAGTLAIPAAYALVRSLRMPVLIALIVALVCALSPWQILRSRAATPPAYVPMFWLLTIWAGILLLQRGDKRSALFLALVAGFGLYSYPPLKMALPLLGFAITLLALLRYGFSRFREWIPAGIALLVIWLPFLQVTFFNADSGMRAQSKLLRTETVGEWISQWIINYATYFSPNFLYISGDSSNGLPDAGVQLWIEAPFAVLGLGFLLWKCWQAQGVSLLGRIKQNAEWYVLLAAILLAPLPASLMMPNPQLTRALAVAPGYAVLVGLGIYACWRMFERRSWPALAKPIFTAAMLAILLWQAGSAYNDYITRFPAAIANKYQDGMAQAMAKAVELSPNYDQVWIDDRMNFPYIFVLAAEPMPPAEAQALIDVSHGRTTFNTIHSIGKYRFTNLSGPPADLPVIEAMPTSLGRPGYVLQEYQNEGERILLVRRMRVGP
jgi:4-amino-4-deoxy-L-arabinose transferase-like glycosyltransferase